MGGEEEESWGIYYKQFFGNPGKKNVWEQLDRYLDTEFSYKNGEKIKILCTCIDTGGHYTNEAYEFIKPREFKRIFGIKGSSQEAAPFIKRPTKTNKGQISLFSLGVSTGKETIMSRLKIDIPGPRYMHFPDDIERGYTETYFKGLTSENKVVTFEKGIRKVKWKIVGDKRNEPLDLRNYSYAALRILNPDLSKKYKIKENEIFQNQKKGRRMIRKGM
ncbi:terminase gpA endonuclease subunit [Streptobacillus moniliformis]|uniref:terminase gpA endonuclease subunit n=1 Tax=Streptobacillus moniliformis TaxID=34105 RepID=UPI0012DAC29E|nr:terminase gpA endonuclease subunit [Streptobacillus moniliformis]